MYVKNTEPRNVWPRIFASFTINNLTWILTTNCLPSASRLYLLNITENRKSPLAHSWISPCFFSRETDQTQGRGPSSNQPSFPELLFGALLRSHRDSAAVTTRQIKSPCDCKLKRHQCNARTDTGHGNTPKGAKKRRKRQRQREISRNESQCT